MSWDYTLTVVSLGCLTIGITSAMAGAFVLLRRQSLLGDVIAHCSLPGVAVAFLLVGERQLPFLLLGALLSGLTGALAVVAITRWARLDHDVALAVVLATFFGAGIVLLSHLQHVAGAAQAGLQTFLLGQAATMLRQDLTLMISFGLLLILATFLLWKEWMVSSFDRDFAACLGLPVSLLDVLLVVLLVSAVVIGLQTVGAVLMSAMLVSPAAAARQWTQRMLPLVLIAAAIGLLSSLVGVLLSDTAVRAPTGPTIVLLAAVIVVVSLLLGRERGVIWQWLRRRSLRRGLLADQLLLAFFQIAGQHDNIFEPRDLGLIDSYSLSQRELHDLLDLLVKRGWVQRAGRRQWALSAAGVERAQQLQAAD